MEEDQVFIALFDVYVFTDELSLTSRHKFTYVCHPAVLINIIMKYKIQMTRHIVEE
jgi:hypothetical protein